jgi:hypothetical protein
MSVSWVSVVLHCDACMRRLVLSLSFFSLAVPLFFFFLFFFFFSFASVAPRSVHFFVLTSAFIFHQHVK